VTSETEDHAAAEAASTTSARKIDATDFIVFPRLFHPGLFKHPVK
jgi:hypothetical protein